MPTGHSSAGGSSHSGGGPIGGGSSHGNSFGGGSRRPFVPGMVIINNRPFRMRGKAGAGFVGCILFALIFFVGAFVGGIFMANASSTKQKIEYDFAHYKDLVAAAKSHDERIVEGEIVSIEKGYGKYRVIYEFERYGRDVEGYSFYVYTSQDLSRFGYSVGEDIEIALESGMFELSLEPDSVPTDIVLFEVTDDGEYVRANTNFKIGVGLLVGSIVLIVVSVAVSVVLNKKFAKPYEESENNPAPPNKTNNENDVTYCEYCGSVLKKGEDKCPGCGARSRK